MISRVYRSRSEASESERDEAESSVDNFILMCYCVLVFCTEAELLKNRKQGNKAIFESSECIAKSTEKNERRKDGRTHRGRHIFQRGQIAPQLLFCGGGSPFTIVVTIAQNNKVLCKLVRWGCAGMREGEAPTD